MPTTTETRWVEVTDASTLAEGDVITFVVYETSMSESTLRSLSGFLVTEGSRWCITEEATGQFCSGISNVRKRTEVPLTEADVLRRELEEVRAEHRRELERLGVDALRMGQDADMCRVLENFMDEHSIPYHGLPVSGTITVTYTVRGFLTNRHDYGVGSLDDGDGITVTPDGLTFDEDVINTTTVEVADTSISFDLD